MYDGEMNTSATPTMSCLVVVGVQDEPHDFCGTAWRGKSQLLISSGYKLTGKELLLQ